MVKRDPRAGLAAAAAGIFLVLYPVVAAAALDRFSPRVIGLIWLGLAAVGIAVRRRLEGRAWVELLLLAVPGVTLLSWAAVFDAALPIRLIPGVVNATLAIVFLRTLFHEQSMVEVGARLIQPGLPDFTRPYCRLSTVIWGGFFIASALVIVVLAFGGDHAAWVRFTTWTYFVAMSILGVGEFLVRKIYFRHYEGGPVDAVFAAVFPAEKTEMGRRSAAFIAKQRVLDTGTD